MKSYCLILILLAFIAVTTTEALQCKNCVIDGWDESKTCTDQKVEEIRRKLSPWKKEAKDLIPDVAEVCFRIKIEIVDSVNKTHKLIISSQGTTIGVTSVLGLNSIVPKCEMKKIVQDVEGCACNQANCNVPQPPAEKKEAVAGKETVAGKTETPKKSSGHQLPQSAMIIFSMIFLAIIISPN